MMINGDVWLDTASAEGSPILVDHPTLIESARYRSRLFHTCGACARFDLIDLMTFVDVGVV